MSLHLHSRGKRCSLRVRRKWMLPRVPKKLEFTACMAFWKGPISYLLARSYVLAISFSGINTRRRIWYRFTARHNLMACFCARDPCAVFEISYVQRRPPCISAKSVECVIQTRQICMSNPLQQCLGFLGSVLSVERRLKMAAMSTSLLSCTNLDASQRQIFRSTPACFAHKSWRSPLPFVNPKQTRVPLKRLQAPIKAGLLEFLSPPAGSATSSRAGELVTELLQLAARTNGGARASDDTQEQLEELVSSYLRQSVCVAILLENCGLMAPENCQINTSPDGCHRHSSCRGTGHGHRPAAHFSLARTRCGPSSQDQPPFHERWLALF
jgi:hypothetical protein